MIFGGHEGEGMLLVRVQSKGSSVPPQALEIYGAGEYDNNDSLIVKSNLMLHC